MTTPTIHTNGENLIFNGRRVGRYGQLPDGTKVFVTWKVFHRVEESYSITTELFDEIPDDVEYIFVIDKDTRDVFKYDRETYENARVSKWNDQRQYSPPFYNFDAYWDSAADELIA